MMNETVLTSRMFRRIAVSAAAIVAGAGLAILPATAASAADPPATCNTETALYGGMSMPAYSGVTPKYLCHLYPGATGNGVKALQLTLNQCYGAHLDRDGIFGKDTTAALKSAQNAAGVFADGDYGTNTRKAFKFPSADTPGLCVPDGGRF